MLKLLVLTLALVHPGVAKQIAAPASPVQSAAQVLAAVQKYYVTTQKLKADFKQRYTNTVFGTSSESLGTVMIKKPGKMRWDYSKPDEKFFISDGELLWVYEKATAQCFKQSLKDQILPVAITFLYGQGDLGRDFNAELDPGKYGSRQDLVLELTPKHPSAQYKHLWLVADPTDFHVKESIVQESSDNVNHFTFTNIRLNDQAKFEDKHFKFVPPKGVKIVEPPKQPQ